MFQFAFGFEGLMEAISSSSSGIFGNIRTSLGNRRKSLDVAVMLSEIPIMTRQKSHTFDSEKVGRYTNHESHD